MMLRRKNVSIGVRKNRRMAHIVMRKYVLVVGKQHVKNLHGPGTKCFMSGAAKGKWNIVMRQLNMGTS